MLVIFLLIVALVVALIVTLNRRRQVSAPLSVPAQPQAPIAPVARTGGDPAMNTLRMRLAQGDITPEEFAARSSALSGGTTQVSGPGPE